MSTLTAIGVYDNLTSRKTRVAMRATNHELTCRIYVISNVALFKERLHFGSRHTLFEHARNENLNHILADLCQHLFVSSSLTTSFFGRDEIIVLRAHYNSIDAHCTVVVVIFHRHLTLRVGTEIGHHLTFATDVSQHNENVVCQRKGERHVAIRFVVGIPKHHTLVACTLQFGSFALNTTVDVVTLVVDGRKNATAVGIKHIFRLGVADALDGAANGVLQIHISLRLHLTSHYHLSGSNEGFASHFRGSVERKKLVKKCV